MGDGGMKPHRRVRVDPTDLDRWCRTHLGAGARRVLFSHGYLSTVLGVELTDGARVVVKVRPRRDRLVGCALVHRLLFERGFPCPELLVDLASIDDLVASAEMMVAEGDPYPRSGRSPAPFAQALARLVALAPLPREIPSLDPPPPWTAPDRNRSELWPDPEDRDLDLNSARGPAWIDAAGTDARARLAASTSSIVVGHGDFYTGNVRWSGEDLAVVWDWDSAIAASEPAIAGLAAAIYPTTQAGGAATIDESSAFLDAYERARGRRFSDEERAEAWASGLWTRAFEAKKEAATFGAPTSLTEAEADERRRRAASP